MAQKIYLADDDRNIRDLMEAFLSQEGFDVRTFADGDGLLAACAQEMPDLVVLDIMMPGTDGLTACAQLRRKSEKLPIIIVSARDDPYDRVTGLSLGGDDYLVKPFLPLELIARVKAVLRRAGAPAAEEEGPLRFGALEMSPGRREASLDGKPLLLTPTEFDFLAYMIRSSDRAVSREELLKSLWKFEWDADTRAVDDMLKRLRRKLKENGDRVRIDTVWGFGFRIVCGE